MSNTPVIIASTEAVTERCNYCGESNATRSKYEGQFLCDECNSIWQLAVKPVPEHYWWRIERPDSVTFKGYYSQEFMYGHYGRMGWQYELTGDDGR
jgi:hypothetical protein